MRPVSARFDLFIDKDPGFLGKFLSEVCIQQNAHVVARPRRPFGVAPIADEDVVKVAHYLLREHPSSRGLANDRCPFTSGALKAGPQRKCSKSGANSGHVREGVHTLSRMPHLVETNS